MIAVCIIFIIMVVSLVVIPYIHSDPHETTITIENKNYYTTTQFMMTGKVLVPYTEYHHDVIFVSEGKQYTEDNFQIYNLEIGRTYKVVRKDFWFLGTKYQGQFEIK